MEVLEILSCETLMALSFEPPRAPSFGEKDVETFDPGNRDIKETGLADRADYIPETPNRSQWTIFFTLPVTEEPDLKSTS